MIIKNSIIFYICYLESLEIKIIFEKENNWRNQIGQNCLKIYLDNRN